MNKLKKSTIEKLEELKKNLSYNAEEDYCELINTLIDYDNEAQDCLYLADNCRESLDVVNDELLEYLLKDNCNCQRLYYFVNNIDYADSIYKINAYGNLENITNDDIIYEIDNAIKNLEDSMEA